MRIFFGKINKDVNTGQLKGGYYISPKSSNKYGFGDEKIDIGDYCFMIGGGTVALWKAQEWKEDRLVFTILKKDVFMNTSSFMAFKYFLIEMPLLVLTKRQSPKAFYPLTTTNEYTEAMLLDDSVYGNNDNYRKIQLRLDEKQLIEHSIHVQLFYDGDNLKLYKSSFWDTELFSHYRDNSAYLGKGRTQKDNTIKKLQKTLAPTEYSSEILSLGSFYDAYFVDYTGEPDPTKIRYWAGGFNGVKSYDRLNNFVTKNYWQAIDYDESDHRFVADESRRLFDEIRIGDKFLIKGIGGAHDLKVHYVGSVLNKNIKDLRLEFESLNIQLYNGKAPKGPGAGNWRNTLLEVKRKEDIELLFKEKLVPPGSGKQSKSLTNPNIILYGPPGTGKTYNSIELAYEIINGSDAPSHKVAQDFFKQERGNQIEFITFHQNYAYEDFVQGLKPDFDNPELRFSKVNGGFFNICTNAIFEYYLEYAKQLPKSSGPDFQVIFNSFVDWLKSTGLQSITFKTKEGNPIKIKDIVNDKYIHAVHGESDVKHTVSSDRLEKLFYAFNDIGEIKNVKDDISEVIGGCNASIFWTFFNELLAFEKRNKEDLKQTVNELAIDSDIFDLEEKRKRINEVGLDKLSTFIENNNSEVPRYVLIIDEINRANISRVFGELITLIESDKRLGQKHEIISTLPSGDAFAIPPNVIIIGTMNTADKSIALVDIALRRRFEFRKKYPLYKEDELNVHFSDELKKMNKKIRELKTPDFQIGHSYFMDDDFDLDYTMNNKIIPLLYEYFMNNTESIKEVLQVWGEVFKYEDTDSGLIEYIGEVSKEESIDTPKTEG